MTISQTITALPTPPNPLTDDSTTYPTKATAFTQALTQFGTELNTLATQINQNVASISLYSGLAMLYSFSSTITDANPGTGLMRLSAVQQNTSTVVRLNTSDANLNGVSSILDLMSASTSAQKGYLKLQHATDITKWLLFNISAVAAPTGYRNVTVSIAASSAASPFTNGDLVAVSFTRTGDVPTSVVSMSATQATTSGTSIDFTSIPAGVKRIVVALSGVSTSGTSIPMLQLGKSAGVETTGYLGAASSTPSGSTSTTTNQTTGVGLAGTWTAANTMHGNIVCNLVNAATNLWAISFDAGLSDSAVILGGGSSKALAGTLDRVRLTTVGGTDTFDAGSAVIHYEM